MACNHCGYNAAIDGSNCPNCGKYVDGGASGLVIIGIIVIIAIFMAVLIGPAFLIYKAYKTANTKRTNWWLMSGMFLSFLLVIYSETVVGALEGDNDLSAFTPYVFYTNLIVFLVAVYFFYLRLKEKQYKLKELFIIN